jgi:sugar lactone lactonase YvrE
MCRDNFEIMRNHDDSGRLLKYDARTKLVTVLVANRPYPNGVALSRDGTHLVVAHTGPCEAHRYWLKGPKAGTYELFAKLPGYPDNVRPDTQGGFWVALNRESQQNETAPVPKPKHLVGVRLNADGKEVEELTAAAGVTLSEVAISNGKLWLGSVELDYIGVL